MTADASSPEERYIDVEWRHDHANDPVRLVSSLDEARWEVRKLEFFRDGSVGYASSVRHSPQTRLGTVQVPSISEINSDDQFRAAEISAQEFNALWHTYVDARA